MRTHRWLYVACAAQPANIIVDYKGKAWLIDFDCSGACPSAAPQQLARCRRFLGFADKNGAEWYAGTRRFASEACLEGGPACPEDDYESLVYSMYWLSLPPEDRWDQPDMRPALEDILTEDPVARFVWAENARMHALRKRVAAALSAAAVRPRPAVAAAAPVATPPAVAAHAAALVATPPAVAAQPASAPDATRSVQKPPPPSAVRWLFACAPHVHEK